MSVKNVFVNFVGLRGGGVSYAYEMVNGLSKNGCFVYAVVSSKMEGLEKWYSIDNIHLFVVKGYSNYFNFVPNLLFFLMIEWKRIKKAIKKVKIDFSYIPMSSYWCPFVYNKTKKIRTYFTLHDVVPHDNKKSFSWRLNNYLAKKADNLIILSNCFKNYVVEKYSIPEENVLVLPIGQQNYYLSNEKEMLDDDADCYFVFYGRIVEYKGLDILLEAFKSVLSNYPNARLVIAGSGDLGKYKALLDAISKDKIIILNRWIKDDEVVTIFKHKKSITVLPYKNATQSGVIPIAMMLKSLVICSDCSGLVEQVKDGETGFIVEANNSISLASRMNYCLRNWDKMTKIVDNAYHYICSLSWDNISKKIIDHAEHYSKDMGK